MDLTASGVAGNNGIYNNNGFCGTDVLIGGLLSFQQK